MHATHRLQEALNVAMLRLLRPLCRLLLRHNVPFAAFEELAKHVYVQTAMGDFGIPGKKPTLSRASILTGLTRKDVQRLVTTPAPERAASEESYNRAARVLTGWARDPDFQDAAGSPALLDPSEGAASFAALVRRYSGDMPARAVLDELLRVGAVTQRADLRLALVTKAYVPQGSEIEKLGILGNDTADLITTIDHNLQHGSTDPRFQRKVMYVDYPADLLPAFRKLSTAQAQALLERLDHWLREHHHEPNDPGTTERVRLGLGIFYFEERTAPENTKE